MTSKSGSDRFRQTMDEHAHRGTWLLPEEAAQMAKEHGLPLAEALRECQRASLSFLPFATGDAFSYASDFVSALCLPASTSGVFEYSVVPSLLAVGHFDGSERAKSIIATPNADAAALFRVLVGSQYVQEQIDCLKEDQKFDLVVCQPPNGQRSKHAHADGFGGEAIVDMAAHVSDVGRLVWMSTSGLLSSKKPKKTFAELQSKGLHLNAVIDLPIGTVPGSNVEGAILVFERRILGKKLVGSLRDGSMAAPMAASLLNGPAKKRGGSWTWLDHEDQRTFKGVENDELLRKLTPRGKRQMVTLSSIFGNDKVQKADKPISDDSTATSFIYIPEYAGSRVTADLEEQTVKPRAVYRFPIDTAKANPRFVAGLLNGPYGRKARSAAATGTTIQRLSAASIADLVLPLPDLETQDQIAGIETDLAILVSGFDELQSTISRDWSVLGDVAESVEKLKSVLQLERQIEEWWRELPYPLAAIYRRYQIATDPKERLDRLLHFFEMAAVYLAAVGTSHVRAIRSDWKGLFAKWFHPKGTAGIERTDFGFWTTLAGASLKELSRTASDKELRVEALSFAGDELVETAHEIGPIGKATKPLDAARRYRNQWKGHGGHLKSSDADRLDHELRQHIRDFFEATAPLFRRLFLVLPGQAKLTTSGAVVQMEVLFGSDPAFSTDSAEFSRPTPSDSLAFWMKSTGSICSAIPFFRLGVPREPQETSFYVFNRVENGGFRWISYQEARQQEFVAGDDELRDLINLQSGDPR